MLSNHPKNVITLRVDRRFKELIIEEAKKHKMSMEAYIRREIINRISHLGLCPHCYSKVQVIPYEELPRELKTERWCECKNGHRFPAEDAIFS